jgi:ribosomal protein S25
VREKVKEAKGREGEKKGKKKKGSTKMNENIENIMVLMKIVQRAQFTASRQASKGHILDEGRSV